MILVRTISYVKILLKFHVLTPVKDGRAARGHTGYTTTGTTHGTTSANDGPHNSKLMNKLDPRVDSDRGKQWKPPRGSCINSNYSLDGNNGFGTEATTTKSFEQSQTQGTATSGTATTNSAHGLGSTNHGPHKSNMMNKLDPRVDSDRGKFADLIDA